ncbi:MAG: protein phosphatase 2C domain-containing protein [Leifsonia sp.]
MGGTVQGVTGEYGLPGAAEAVQVRFGARSDVGRVRRVNEDGILAAAGVFLVADGMGGHAKGDAASRAVVEIFAREADELTTPQLVLDAIERSNDDVRLLSDVGEEGTAVAGTTLSGVAFVDAGDGSGFHWMVFNVGDSRVYRWDGRRLGQVSVDHSAVQELVDAGLLEQSEAENHPDRNIITRAIGAEDDVDVDVWLIPAVGRQVFIVCSDGLSKEVDDDDIVRMLLSCEASGPEDGAGIVDAANALVDEALDRGARDNVSVVIVESRVGAPAEVREATRDRDGGLRSLEDTRPRV